MKNTKVLYMVKVSLLLAVILLMSLTPLGYLRVGPMEITFLCVPVAVGAVLLGPSAGAVLGLAFGVTSFIKAVTDPLFGVIVLDSPWLAALVCIVPRVIIGPAAAFVPRFLLKIDKTRIFAYAAAGLVCSLLNTVLFLSGIIFVLGGLLTRLAGMPAEMVVTVFVGVGVANGLPEAAAATLLTAAVCKAVSAAEERTKGGRQNTPDNPPSDD
jgi:uncharacterized membrane protein